VDKPNESNRVVSTTTTSATPTKQLAGHSPSPELLDGNHHLPPYHHQHYHHHLHHGHPPVTISKSVSPPNTKATPPKYLVSEAPAYYGHYPPSRTREGVVVKSSSQLMTSSERTKLLLGGIPPSSGQSPTEKDKDYSYVKFPLRVEPPHEYSYPKLIDAYRHDATPPNQQPPSGTTPTKKGTTPPIASEEKASSSSSSTSSKKSRRSLPSLVLPCGGGADEDSSHAPLSPQVDLGSGQLGGADNASTSMTLTCAHCRESFSHASNRRGACPYAPNDWARSTVETVTCLSCAKCLLYHCMSDAEGDYGGHPCECSNTDGTWGRRWLGLTLLSILVPCLCCYLPLMACYKGGAACSLCGGRHQVAK
jgi:hypothetical protein